MSAADTIDLTRFIRDVPDFPKPGIIFKDITPLLGDPAAFAAAVEAMAAPFAEEPIDYVVAVESRGFIFAAPLALKLGAGFTPVRKPGKLPFDTMAHSYDLEYGSDTLEIHIDGVKQGDRVLVVDDLLATGGTVLATLELLKRLGAEIVGCTFLVELAFLPGRAKIGDLRTHSVIVFD